MDGGLNNGHIVNNNNLSNCTNTSLTYSVGTPASISSNTFTGCNNAIYLKVEYSFIFNKFFLFVGKTLKTALSVNRVQ